MFKSRLSGSSRRGGGRAAARPGPAERSATVEGDARPATARPATAGPATARTAAARAATANPSTARGATANPARPARTSAGTKPPGTKSDATRRKLLDRALKLFQQRGVEATTMRSIARAAGLSLGAAYYYFPSKEALMFAYYEANQDQAEAEAEAATGTLRDRLGAAFHARLTSLRAQRRMLAALVNRLVDPGDALSALSPQQRAVRERSIAVLAGILGDAGLSPGTVRLVASALWLCQMAALLVFLHDESPDQMRTHRLVDDALDLVIPMLPILDTPFGRDIAGRIVAALDRAGVSLSAPAADVAATHPEVLHDGSHR